MTAKGEAEHLTDAHGRVRPIDHSPVNSDPPLFRQFLGKRPSLHDPGKPEEFVEPKRVSHV
jgi:hypothetical protein